MNYIRTLQSVWILYLMTCAAQENNSTFTPAHVKLINYLMNGYNKGARPVLNWREPTTVHVYFKIYAILGVDEQKQALSTYIWYDQSWTDEFLTWDPEKFDNISTIRIPADWIWLPDIVIVELVENGDTAEKSYVSLSYDGEVIHSKPLQITSSCHFDIYYFPFDQHNCSLSFTSWSHTTQDIHIFFALPDSKKKSFTSEYVNHGDWDILKVAPKNFVFHDYLDQAFGTVLFQIIIKRNPMFHLVNMVLPSMLLMIINMAGFFIPPECGERISFKVTLLLGYSVFLILVSEQSPPTGTPLIGSYFAICMVLLVISVVESVFIVNVVYRHHLHPAVPEWIRILVLEKMATLLCLKDKDFSTALCSAVSHSTEQNESSSTEKLAKDSDEDITFYNRPLSTTQDPEVLKILKEILSVQETQKKNTDWCVPNEWALVAYVIDTFLFRSYVIVVLVCIVSITALWAQWFRA